MIFLIEYDRRSGRILTFRNFDRSQRQDAQEQRLNIELDRNREGVDREVVLLDANNEHELRQTHRRYFGDFDPIPTTNSGKSG